MKQLNTKIHPRTKYCTEYSFKKVCNTHWTEVTISPRPLDLLSWFGSFGLIGLVCQSTGSCFTPQLIDLLDVFVLQGTDGLKAARQTSFESVSGAQWFGALSGLVFDAQSFEEEGEFVRGAVGDQYLDVLREQLHSAFAVPDELSEKPELLQVVILWDFSVVDTEDYFLKLIPAQYHRGLPEHLPPCGLACGVELLHCDTALQLSSVIPFKHRRNFLLNKEIL